MKKYRVTHVVHSKSHHDLLMAKESIMLVINQVRGGEKAGLQQAGSHNLTHSANARMPWGDTTARQVAEVPGATLDAHRLHAASVLF